MDDLGDLDLLAAWHDATLAADLAERLAKSASDAADELERGADEAEAIASLAEHAAEAADEAADAARRAAERARERAHAARSGSSTDADEDLGRARDGERDARQRYERSGGGALG